MKIHFGNAPLAVALVVTAVLDSSTPAFAQWTAGASTPTPIVRGLGAWFPSNSRFYVLGGRSADTAGSDLLNPIEYNPVANTWTTKSGLFPSNEVNNMVGGVLNDAGTPYIYAVGGSAAAATTATPSVRRYDPIADAVTTVTTDPWPAIANTVPGGGGVFNNKLYVFGGFTVNVGMISDIWQFDPAAAPGSRWSLKTASLPVAMGYVPTALVGGIFYIGGGSLFSAGTILDSNNSYAYDPTADTITPILPIPRATGETRAVNEGGAMWVLGGGRVAPNPSNEVDAFAPGAGTWSLAPAFVTARRNAPVDVDPTGVIYLVGGYTPATPSNNMEIFRPANNPAFCFGDGTGTACPCGNSGTAGNGCANSLNANGANLTATGTASITGDTLVLMGSGMPNSSALYFEGTTQISTVFGDGLRCAGGAVVRLGTKSNTGGTSQYGPPGDAGVATHRPDLPGDVRTYQCWYRNADPTFCTASTFNLSNGYSVTWLP